MKRSELKTGMLLEFADGNVAMVLKGTENGDIYAGADTWAPLSSNINEDLSCKYKNTEVVKVYQPRYNSSFLAILPAQGVDFSNKSNYLLIYSKSEKETALQKQFKELQSQIKELQTKATEVEKLIKEGK